MPRSRVASSDAEDRSEGSSKVQKTSHPTTVRLRRAARACDRCRASKLRCKAPDPSTEEKRCAHCLKIDADCHYTNPPPTHATTANHDPVLQSEGNERLAKLESSMAKILEMMERNVSPAQQRPLSSFQRVEMATHDPTSVPHHFHQSSALNDLAQVNDEAVPPPSEGFYPWLPPSGPPNNNPSPDIGPNFMFDTLVTAAVGNAHVNIPSPAARPGGSIVSISPNASSDHRITPGSHQEAVSGDHYTTTKARPIPKVGAGSRMAAFIEPAAHEAPFRPLAYNPDTFRNAEMADPSGEGSDEGTAGGAVISHTPKRGRGDPIDRGVLTESKARALFDFFHDEMSFFMHIFEEPMTFDHVRYRSSFLLSTILAVAAKYNCTSVKSHPDNATPLGLAPSPSDKEELLVEEETWFQIRALSLSGYLQALISKVHCLEDVQATLLMCAWGLQDRGTSPDPWILTGSAYRLAKRLGIHLVAGALASGTAQPTARMVASWKTYLCLYAFDRFFTVGFGRPETEGFDERTVDTSVLLAFLQSKGDPNLDLICSPESAACVVAYVELADLAKRYSHLVNSVLKSSPSLFLNEMRDIGGMLDAFSSRWLWARSPLASKLGRATRPIKVLYNHIRLCLYTVPLKPISHPDSELFLSRTGLHGASDALAKCLKKAQDSAVGVIQDFADDSRDDSDTVLCYAFDYVFMVLAHSAAVLLSLSAITVCGVGSSPLYDKVPSPAVGMDRSVAMRYYEMTVSAMVDSNRSANFFPHHMACNLSLIADEMGVTVADSTDDGQGCRIGRVHQCAYANSQRHESALDFSLLDIDQFLQPGFFEDGGLFSNSLLM